MINRAIVREGKPYPPKSLYSLEILPGVSEALSSLKAVGFMLIVVTNQPDVARGVTARETVEQINEFLLASLPIDEIYTCFHDDKEECECRKPRPGALFAAAKTHAINLGASYMVGDRWRDIEAGQLAGCQTFLIDYGYKERRPESVDYTVASLTDVAAIILGFE